MTRDRNSLYFRLRQKAHYECWLKKEHLWEWEKRTLLEALEKHNNDLHKAAKSLELSSSNFRLKLKRVLGTKKLPYETKTQTGISEKQLEMRRRYPDTD